jgi:hypothetical protein
MSERQTSDLEYILENYFNIDIETNYESIGKYIKNPEFPGRDEKFKGQLARAILNNEITPEIYEDLTDAELETQEEVDKFLIDEIWKPIYGDEPIK